MKIKIFLDEDVHSGLAPALRKRGFDVVHAQELDRKGRTDREQLEWASQEERCIVSFNVKDFVLTNSCWKGENTLGLSSPNSGLLVRH